MEGVCVCVGREVGAGLCGQQHLKIAMEQVSYSGKHKRQVTVAWLMNIPATVPTASPQAQPLSHRYCSHQQLELLASSSEELWQMCLTGRCLGLQCGPTGDLGSSELSIQVPTKVLCVLS